MSKGDNDQILNDIQKLQNIEKELFSSLENPQLQSAEIQKIISKINDISQMRVNLNPTYLTLEGDQFIDQ